MTRVSRSAVSNWRKRHHDFPEPRVRTDSGLLFELRAVEEWLLRHEKLEHPVPAGVLVWRFADAVRGAGPIENLVDCMTSWLCYLEACHRATASEGTLHRGGLDVPPEYRWSTVQDTPDDDLATALRRAGHEIERRNPMLDGLFGHLAPEPFPSPPLLRSLVQQLEAADDGLTPRFALFEELLQRGSEIGAHAFGESTTPESVSALVQRVVGPIEDGATVADPACGSGGLLWTTALAGHVDEGPVLCAGEDRNEAAARRARARFFLYGVDAEITTGDSLRRDPAGWLPADVVVTDPPYGLGNWGDAELYRSTRWAFGAPPASCADLAWVQLCLSLLKPEGRAAVVLPVASLYRTGRELAVRAALVEAGVVEAVIELPPRLRRNTSIPLAVWVLRGHHVAPRVPDTVLLVDASRLGTPGRSVHGFREPDIDRVAHVLRMWRSHGSLDAVDTEIAIAVPTRDILLNDACLAPRRYRPVLTPRTVEELAALRDEAEEQVRRGAQRALDTLVHFVELGPRS